MTPPAEPLAVDIAAVAADVPDMLARIDPTALAEWDVLDSRRLANGDELTVAAPGTGPDTATDAVTFYVRRRVPLPDRYAYARVSVDRLWRFRDVPDVTRELVGSAIRAAVAMLDREQAASVRE